MNKISNSELWTPSNEIKPYPESPLFPGCVGLWTPDSASDGVWYDRSGNGNHGVVSGARMTPQGYWFDGVDDYIEFNSAKLKTLLSLSVCVWMQVSNVVEHRPACSQYINHGGYKFGLTTLKSGEAQFDTSADTLNPPPCPKVTGSTNCVSRWCFISGSVDTNFIKLYVDGNLESTQALSIPLEQASCSLFIGRRTYHRNVIVNTGYAVDYHCGSFLGIIATASLYNRALTSAEIRQMYEIDRSFYGV